ncbi:MAG: hypothetical protein H7210_07930 [Pyrinomonadaceae bacterium]|nr:hypothetical protein [Phycisphaerales bacterium]
MESDVIALWDRYVLLEAHRSVIAGGLMKTLDPGARLRDIELEQTQLRTAIGEPLFLELVAAEL